MTAKHEETVGYKRIVIYVILFLSLCLLAFAASRYLQKQTEEKDGGRRRLAFAPNAEADNGALLAFKNRFPDRKICLACEQDVTDDGLPDLLVIYEEGSLVRFVTAIARPGSSDGVGSASNGGVGSNSNGGVGSNSNDDGGMNDCC